MFPTASGIVIHGGTFHSQTNRISRGMDLLMEWVAAGAFHNSDELYDAPKCHPHTRVAVLEDIMRWVGESESAREDFILWLFGPAGVGKSAIAKRIAEIAAEEGVLIATFFFSRTSATRSCKDRLIPTLAYQLALTIPETRSHIEDAIERDPAIFKKNTQTQIDTLLIKPFQSAPTHFDPFPKLIIIDGLDECKDRQAQVAILDAFSRSFHKHNVPIIFLVVSRPELDITTSFNSSEPLRSIHRRLALDDTYLPNDDIRLFFSDNFELIKHTHPLRSTIPISWPTQQILELLVEKSSGQFIYAATVVRFIESKHHRPTARLDMILGISPPGKMNPFSELDALYNHILSSVDDIQLTLRVLSLCLLSPNFVFGNLAKSSISPEFFLSLEEGDIYFASINLSSIISYDEPSRRVKVLHASLVDFLSDERRSTIFYIDMADTCTDFVHRIFEYVKGPDGVGAGDVHLFQGVLSLYLFHKIPQGRLRSDILNFDIEAFIKVAIKHYFMEHTNRAINASVLDTFYIWTEILDAGLDDGDKNEALVRCKESFESRVQKYQSDWRLQLLLTLTAQLEHPPDQFPVIENHDLVPACRVVDILLEMDNDHDLHLIDLDALDLRHGFWDEYPRLFNKMSFYVDGGRHAFAALHCMRFLSNPPKYPDSTDSSEMAFIYIEWKATCAWVPLTLCGLLQEANTAPELVQFISNNDMHTAVQELLSVDYVRQVDAHLLAFLSRASVCINWRIISAVKRALVITDQPPSTFEKKHAILDEQEDDEQEDDEKEDDEQEDNREKLEDWEISWRLMELRVDQCCSRLHGVSQIRSSIEHLLK